MVSPATTPWSPQTLAALHEELTNVEELDVATVEALIADWSTRDRMLTPGWIAAWARVGVLAPDQVVELDRRRLHPEEVRRFGLADLIGHGDLPAYEAGTLLLRLRGERGQQQLARETVDQERLERDRAARDGAIRERYRRGDASSATPQPPAGHDDVLTVAGIARSAIAAYTAALPRTRYGADTATAAAAAVEQVTRTFASEPGDAGSGLGPAGEFRLAAEQVQAIAADAIGLCSGYRIDDGHPASVASDRALRDLLAASPLPQPHLARSGPVEPVATVIGTAAERGELAAVRAHVQTPAGRRWVERLDHPDGVVNAALRRHAGMLPTRELRARIRAAAAVLKDRPPDPAAEIDMAVAQLRRLRSRQRIEAFAMAWAAANPTAHVDGARLQALAGQMAKLERGLDELAKVMDQRGAFDERHLVVLARAEQYAAELGGRELDALDRVAAAPPDYLRRALGAPPDVHATRRDAWIVGARLIEQYRVDHQVTDTQTALGRRPAGEAEQSAHDQAVTQLAEIQRTLGRGGVAPPEPQRQLPAPPDPEAIELT